MKNASLILLMAYAFVFLIACQNNSKEQSQDDKVTDTVTLIKYTHKLSEVETYHFEYDNSDFNSFGYLILEGDPEIFGPWSIAVLNSKVFIMDKFYSTIKCFDYQNETLISSQIFSEEPYKMGYFELFNQKLVLTLENSDSIVILNPDLGIYKKIKVFERGRTYSNNEELLISYPEEDTLVVFSKNFEIKRAGKRERIDYSINGNGKNFKIVGDTLHYEDLIVDLSNKLDSMCHFFDFDRGIFAYYEIDPHYASEITPLTLCIHRIVQIE